MEKEQAIERQRKREEDETKAKERKIRFQDPNGPSETVKLQQPSKSILKDTFKINSKRHKHKKPPNNGLEKTINPQSPNDRLESTENKKSTNGGLEQTILHFEY